MNIVQLLEVRKNPDKNLKISPYKRIQERIKTVSKIGSTKNLFVSFTKLDKLGINPSSEFDTPLGIYSYPAEYVLQEAQGERMSRLPYAGGSPYVNIFEAQGNIVDLNEMAPEEANAYYKRMVSWALEKSGHVPDDDDNWKRIADDIEKTIHFSPISAAHPNSVGGKFWYVSMEVSKNYGKSDRHSVSWNNLFRHIGIDGCVDTGTGIIHMFEPNQGVFFNKAAIKNNERVFNKWGEDEQEQAKHTGNVNKKSIAIIKSMNPQTLRQKVGVDPIMMLSRIYAAYKKIPEDIQEIAVKKVPQLILNLMLAYKTVPSEKIQLTAIRFSSHEDRPFIDSLVRLLIKNGIDITEKVQLAAVEKYPPSIRHIPNPSERVRRKAVDN